MQADKLENTLNGGYIGLYAEVVLADAYRLKKLNFAPDIIFDLGANIGVFTRYARTLFPNAKIISVEPDKDNCEVFRHFTKDDNTILIEKAIGIGKIWRCEQDINGAHESYLSSGLGYPFVVGEPIPRINETEIECIMPHDLINEYVKNGDRFIIKMDIEAAENIIWDNLEAMAAIRNADYVCMELHFGALHGGLVNEVRESTFAAIFSFEQTHRCEMAHPMFYALKKQYVNSI